MAKFIAWAELTKFPG